MGRWPIDNGPRGGVDSPDDRSISAILRLAAKFTANFYYF
jgi:hypothetical protein